MQDVCCNRNLVNDDDVVEIRLMTFETILSFQYFCESEKNVLNSHVCALWYFSKMHYILNFQRCPQIDLKCLFVPDISVRSMASPPPIFYALTFLLISTYTFTALRAFI